MFVAPACWPADYDGESQRIEPYKGAAALAFLANHADFPEPLVVDWEQDEDEDEERRFTIRIPRRLANRVERAAKERNLSFNSYAMRCFEQCVVGDRRVARLQPRRKVRRLANDAALLRLP